MIKIRNYNDKDCAQVEQICIGTSSNEFTANPLLRDALLVVFCHYYIEKEPQNCFVAADENDTIAGYIFCAADFQKWERMFHEEYLEQSANPATKMMGTGAIEGLKKFAETYPAHLHINLDEVHQRCGLGTKLMDALVQHLKENGVPGLMLCVAADNEKGIHFYEKYGFQILERTEQEIAMGIVLNNYNFVRK